MRQLRFVIAAAAVAAMLVLADATIAAPPAPGELRVVPGQCVGLPACTPPPPGVLSLDGRDVYATVATAGGAIPALHRAPGAALPTALGGPFACVGTTGSACQLLDGTERPGLAALSPDGHYLYVLASNGASLYVFGRAAATGKLIPRWDEGACFSSAGFSVRCDVAPTLVQANQLVVGDDIVIAGRSSGRFTIFDRDRATGRLSFDPHACLSAAAFGQCRVVAPLPTAPTPIGAHIYGLRPDGAQAFTHAVDGSWQPVPGPLGCIAAASCPGASPTGLAAAPGATAVYALGDGAFGELHRNPATGLLTPVGRCFIQSFLVIAGCTTGLIPDLTFGEFTDVALAFDASGTFGVFAGDGIATLQRTPATGALSTLSTLSLCSPVPYACTVGSPSLTLAADGHVALWSSKLAQRSLLLATEQPPGCDTHERHTAIGVALPLALACTDINGDAVTAALKTPPAHGVVTGLTPAGAVYRPVPGFTGRDSFTLHVGDGVGTADLTIPVVVAGASVTSLEFIETPFPFPTSVAHGVPGNAVFYRDPAYLSAVVKHGGGRVMGARVVASGWGGTAAGVTDELGNADFSLPTLRNHRIQFKVAGGAPAGKVGQFDLLVSPDIDLDVFYSVKKGKIRYGAHLLAQASARAGRVKLQKKVHGKWRTVQTVKIDRRLHFLTSLPKAQYRGPWRFSYVARTAPYFPAVYDFTLQKPARVAGVAGGGVRGRAIPGRRGH